MGSRTRSRTRTRTLPYSSTRTRTRPRTRPRTTHRIRTMARPRTHIRLHTRPLIRANAHDLPRNRSRPGYRARERPRTHVLPLHQRLGLPYGNPFNRSRRFVSTVEDFNRFRRQDPINRYRKLALAGVFDAFLRQLTQRCGAGPIPEAPGISNRNLFSRARLYLSMKNACGISPDDVFYACGPLTAFMVGSLQSD